VPLEQVLIDGTGVKLQMVWNGQVATGCGERRCDYDTLPPSLSSRGEVGVADRITGDWIWGRKHHRV